MESGGRGNGEAGETPPPSDGRARDYGLLRQQWKSLIQRYQSLDRDSDEGRATAAALNAEARELARETVEKLSCSCETAELLCLVEMTPYLSYLKAAAEKEIARLFSPHAASGALHGLAASANASRPGLNGWLTDWIAIAAQVMPLEDMDAWTAQFQQPHHRNVVRMGGMTRLAQTDPEDALARFLVDYKGLGRDDSDSGVPRMMTEFVSTLSAHRRWAELEQMLPSGGAESITEYMRSRLLEDWGKADPAAAANYVLANADRMEPRHMGSAVAQYIAWHPESGTNWVQDILPPGPMLDGAIKVAFEAIFETYPEQSRQLLDLLTDAKTKAELMAWFPTGNEKPAPPEQTSRAKGR